MCDRCHCAGACLLLHAGALQEELSSWRRLWLLRVAIVQHHNGDCCLKLKTVQYGDSRRPWAKLCEKAVLARAGRRVRLCCQASGWGVRSAPPKLTFTSPPDRAGRQLWCPSFADASVRARTHSAAWQPIDLIPPAIDSMISIKPLTRSRRKRVFYVLRQVSVSQVKSSPLSARLRRTAASCRVPRHSASPPIVAPNYTEPSEL